MNLVQIQLPGYPTGLPENVEVRDFHEQESGVYMRVVMEVDLSVKADHFHMTAQAWQMNDDGTFKQAPNGYASRSNTTTHTVHQDSIGDTIEMDDAWVRHTSDVTADDLMTMPRFDGRPNWKGERYGDLVWDPTAQNGAGQAWRWQEGFADGTARAKVENLLRVLNTSDLRSGFAFRKKEEPQWAEKPADLTLPPAAPTLPTSLRDPSADAMEIKA